ncbi:hypothetical protein BBJ28_00005497 [Nothophytophthora sp. Chile5]|nr:hypothetical protein BBJ28_00005497 [Nothophytophthora sp. Chile5]
MASLETGADRRRHVRALLLAAAKARAADALTLKAEDAATPLFAPFSPSPLAVIDAVWARLEEAQIALTPGDLLVDLGCGDGRWLVSGVQRFKCSALGVELDAALVARTQAAVLAQGLEHKIQVQQGDVMLADVSRARLVIVYAFAESLAGIAQRLRAKLGADANVLSIGVGCGAGGWHSDG